MFYFFVKRINSIIIFFDFFLVFLRYYLFDTLNFVIIVTKCFSFCKIFIPISNLYSSLSLIIFNFTDFISENTANISSMEYQTNPRICLIKSSTMIFPLNTKMPSSNIFVVVSSLSAIFISQEYSLSFYFSFHIWSII